MQEKSYLTSAIRFLEEVIKMIDEGQTVDVGYMDFVKLLTRSLMIRLMQKIKICGLFGDLVDWNQNLR